jgi:hypothetical protein
MRINENGILIDKYSKNLERRCTKLSCNKKYRIIEYLEGSEGMFYPPVNYIQGCSSSCLECWLGVSELMKDNSPEEHQDINNLNLKFPSEHDHWYNENNYTEIDSGNIEITYDAYLKKGCHLAFLPLSRVSIDRTIFLPCGFMVYPEGRLDFSSLDFDFVEECELSSIQSLTSKVTIDDFNSQPILVLPLNFNWNSLLFNAHSEHMELIRTLSEIFDSMFFNLLKFKNCKLTYIPDEGLPNSLGQIGSKSMMAGALFSKNGTSKAKLIGGAAYTHRITRGLGLVLNQPEWEDFPFGGEVGSVVRHALFLYSQLLHTESATARFIQALSLLEYLAFPYEYRPMKKVKTVISRYVSKNEKDRHNVLRRFEELTSKINDAGEQIGFRTRIVHIGARLEDLVSHERDRIELFLELDNYIRSVVNHMIKHSELTFIDYDKLRQSM